jgi:hypothetical protein
MSAQKNTKALRLDHINRTTHAGKKENLIGLSFHTYPTIH